MLQYLIIVLDDTSTSFCHYGVPKDQGKRLISLDDLKSGIRFAMMENLMIQFVYPKEELPKRYVDIINSIDHIDIRPFDANYKTDSDVVVFNEFPLNLSIKEYPTTVFRLTVQEFLDFPPYLAKEVFSYVKRLNIVIKDIDPIQAWDLKKYKLKVEEMSEWLEQEYANGRNPQWNILTDRIMLSEMNNCGAGDTAITLAPNGKFYICPAFYYEDTGNDVGDLLSGLNITNQHLYKIDYAPICRHCDAYQCRRCVWLNHRMTLEVNTPSHEQCVVAHIERNASRLLLKAINRNGLSLTCREIKELHYLDPFENKEQWQQENL